MLHAPFEQSAIGFPPNIAGSNSDSFVATAFTGCTCPRHRTAVCATGQQCRRNLLDDDVRGPANLLDDDLRGGPTLAIGERMLEPRHGFRLALSARALASLTTAATLCIGCGDAPPDVRPDGGADRPGTPDAATTMTDAPVPLPPLRVFVSSVRYTSNLKTLGGQTTGLASADALCQGLANAARLSGTYRAWLSTSTVDAIDHIEGTGPWHRTDGVMAFPDHASLSATPQVKISHDETGSLVDPTDGNFLVWTGTAVGGRRTPPSGAVTNTTCLDWTSTTGAPNIRGTTGYFGVAAAPGDGPAWTHYVNGYCGGLTRHLYCFEQ